MGIYTIKNTYHIAEYYHNIAQQHPLQYGHQFILQFIAPDGQTGKSGTDAFGTAGSESTDCLTYWARSASIPTITIGKSNVKFLANDFQIPGVIDYGEGSWNVGILMDQDLTQYKKLQAWHTLISDFSKSGGGKKVIPNVKAKVSLLDNTMQNINHIFVMQGVWLKDLGTVSMEYSNGGAALATCAATFQYQYFYPADDLSNPTASDPLSQSAVDSIKQIYNTYVS